jgi:galactokinase/mevalonate kinase-like predicted kinase
MCIELKIPARINILGNPSDANEGDFATISAAIDLYAYAHVKPADRIILEIYSDQPGLPGANSLICLEAPLNSLPFSYGDESDILKAPVNRLYSFSEEFRKKISNKGVHITLWTEVPRQSGLGGSSLLILLILTGLRSFYSLDSDQHNNYAIAELTQRVEAKELGITCGYADRYVPLFGGLAYIDYRGKLYQKEIYKEPLATYERMNNYADRLKIVAACTGLQHESGDVHGPMRARYLDEYKHWQTVGGEIPPMLHYMREAWETAWRGKIALLDNDMLVFGQLMNRNHDIVNQMMEYCEFHGGAGWANNMLINTALKEGALGAKLTGAGQGGSVFALINPKNRGKIITTWEETIRTAGLENAYVYSPRIIKSGLTIKKTKAE